MQIITLDFETYFAQDYTLSKLTTEEYIRDPRFQIIGVGVKVGDAPGQWFSGSLSETREWLHQFDLHEHAVVAHNAMFDMAILNWKLGIRPKLILDTLSMARPIHGTTVGGSLAKLVAHYQLGTKGTDTTWAKGLRREDFSADQLREYGGYCATREDSDCNLTWRLFHKLLPLTPRPELLLIDATVRLFTEPRLALDRALLDSHLSSTRAEKERLLLAVSARATIKEGLRVKRLTKAQHDALSQRIRDGDEATILLLAQDLDAAKKILMSNPQMAELLIEHGVEPPRKISPTTGKETWAFAKSDKEFAALLEHDDPAVQAIVAARLGVKSTIEETRTERLIGISKRGLLPVPLLYSGAGTTMRWSGGDKLNMQNLRRGGALRKAIVATPGNAIVVGDMANIELRVNHCLAGQTDSISAFVERRDLYTEFAARLFNKPASEITKDERFLGKLCIAEGSLVLTDAGLVPIEQVTTLHRVWDGVEWVNNGGAIYNGEAEVITYEEVTATPDHIVYLRDGRSCRLEEAANAADCLARTGNGGAAVGLGADFVERNPPRGEGGEGALPVRSMRAHGLDQPGQSSAWNDGWVPAVQSATTSPVVAGQARELNAAAMREREQSSVQELWGQGDRIQISVGTGSVPLHPKGAGAAQRNGVGQDGQQRALRIGKPAVHDPQSEWQQPARINNNAFLRDSDEVPGSAVRGQYASEYALERAFGGTNSGALGAAITQTKRRVWDILDAGPRHRFTVSGRLVSNCHLSLGYGCGYKKFREICRLYKVDTTEIRAQEIVSLWRNTYRAIPRLWDACDESLNAMANGSMAAIGHGPVILTFTSDDGTCGFDLASGHRIRYADLKSTGDGWTYYTNRGRKTIYGGKIVENLCQSISRHILGHQWLLFADWLKASFPAWAVVLQVHDELVATGPEDEAPAVAAGLERALSTAPPWWPDLPLAAEVGWANNYGSAKS